MTNEDQIRLQQIRVDAENYVNSLNEHTLIAQLAISACLVHDIAPHWGSPPNWRRKVLSAILEDALLKEAGRHHTGVNPAT